MPDSKLRSFFTRTTHYQGQVDAANSKSGFGKQSQSNGLLYEGQWTNGLRHGHGILYRKQPDTELFVKIYAGGWEGGKKHGLGVKYYRNGKYLGCWEQDQRSGQGFMWFDSGDFYIGEWIEDRYDGLGVFLEIGGNRYHGQFRGGLNHGEGLYLHMRTGQIQRGFWNEGVFKMGVIEDWNRNQAIEPTAYPIPEQQQQQQQQQQQMQQQMQQQQQTKTILSLLTADDGRLLGEQWCCRSLMEYGYMADRRRRCRACFRPEDRSTGTPAASLASLLPDG
ncbi:MORN repeat-containing protein 3-like [Ochlerotatus camptorhynchus]|uniref:MORN repeat-containing protein 3-like n=1 Tax=Ochlerotatus camptorhynchus TaxID=644619 RepID=UPI0031DD46F7